jgi:hypothetical protein
VGSKDEAKDAICRPQQIAKVNPCPDPESPVRTISIERRPLAGSRGNGKWAEMSRCTRLGVLSLAAFDPVSLDPTSSCPRHIRTV